MCGMRRGEEMGLEGSVNGAWICFLGGWEFNEED